MTTRVKRDLVRRSVVPPIVMVLLAILVFYVFISEPEASEARATSRSLVDDLGGVALPIIVWSFLRDCATVLYSQLWTVSVLVLFAFVPGVAGMIYRRAFWAWFLLAMGPLFTLNLISYINGTGSVGAELLATLTYPYTIYLGVEAAALLLFLAARLRMHTPKRRGAASTASQRNIVVCIDGTWNHPGQTDYGYQAATNVYKLWHATKGDVAPKGKANANECKRYGERQVALYYHGVGNVIENSALGQVFGGVFGLGAEATKERAYLDIVRESRPGDRIFLFGFSRGAAIARLVAGTVEKRGFPTRLWTIRFLGRIRPVWISKGQLSDDEAPTVEVLGCWDTVGSFGIPTNLFGIPFQRIDLLKNLTVALSVKQAYHLLALDETRDAFVPSKMTPDPLNPTRIVEVWFSGNHANVGGGYATDGLSDHALAFLLRRISSGYSETAGEDPGNEDWGIYLEACAPVAVDGLSTGGLKLRPDPNGRVRKEAGPLYKNAPRKLGLNALVHESVLERMRDPRARYGPESLFDLNRRILERRTYLEEQINKMKPPSGTCRATGTISEDAAADIQRWGNALTIDEWRRSALRLVINPPSELANPQGGPSASP